MKIKALWGFVGDKGHVRQGDEIEVSKEYGHTLIGKGLAKEVTESTSESKPESKKAPAESKQATPKEDK